MSCFQTLCHILLNSHDLELELPNILSTQLSFLAFCIHDEEESRILWFLNIKSHLLSTTTDVVAKKGIMDSAAKKHEGDVAQLICHAFLLP